jgi:hypothetical protein
LGQRFPSSQFQPIVVNSAHRRYDSRSALQD